MTVVLPNRVLHRKSWAAQSPACQSQQACSRELKFNLAFHEVVVHVRRALVPAKALSPLVAARVAVILSLAVKRSNLILRPRHYVRTQNRLPL